MVWQWHHFLPASKTRQSTLDRVCHIVLNWKLLHIVHAKLCLTEHYHINSKNGVNFQVTLKWNHAKRNHIKRDLCVMRFVFIIFCVSLCSNVQSFFIYLFAAAKHGVTERACLALLHQSLAWDIILCQFHPPLITCSVTVNHCNNVLSSPFHFSKWPFYFKEFICRAWLFPYNFHFQS